MARNDILIDAHPSDVFAALMDPKAYPEWVVGARRIRRVDPEWPRPGSSFHHESWLGLVPVRDRTFLLEADPERSVVLNARLRPAGTAGVTLKLEAESGGTRVRMNEKFIKGVAAKVWNPVFDMGMWLRNAESLRRLKRLVEKRAGTIE